MYKPILVMPHVDPCRLDPHVTSEEGGRKEEERMYKPILVMPHVDLCRLDPHVHIIMEVVHVVVCI